MYISNITVANCSATTISHGAILARQAEQDQLDGEGSMSKWALGGTVLGIIVGIGMLAWAGAILRKCATGNRPARESRTDHAQRVAPRQNSGPEEHQAPEEQRAPEAEKRQGPECLPSDDPPLGNPPLHAHLAHPIPTRPGRIKFIDADFVVLRSFRSSIPTPSIPTPSILTAPNTLPQR